MNHAADLDIPFLYKALQKLREMPLDARTPASNIFFELVPVQFKDNDRAARFVRAHIEYLRDIGLLELAGRVLSDIYSQVRLTAQGRDFLQPELAQFHGAVTGQLVSAVEAQIDKSTLSDDEKHTWKYKLREALATHAVDVAAKVLVEIFKRLAIGN